MAIPSTNSVLLSFYSRYAGHAVFIKSKLDAVTFLVLSFALFGKDVAKGQYRIEAHYSSSLQFRFGGRYVYGGVGLTRVGAAFSLADAKAAVEANNFDAVFGMVDGGGYANPIAFENHYALFVKVGDGYTLCDELSPFPADLSAYQWVDLKKTERSTYKRFIAPTTLFTSEKGYKVSVVGMFGMNKYVVKWVEGEDAGLLSTHLWTPSMVAPNKPAAKATSSKYKVGDVVILNGDSDNYTNARVVTRIVSDGEYNLKWLSNNEPSVLTWFDHEIKGLSDFPWNTEAPAKKEPPSMFKVGDICVFRNHSPQKLDAPAPQMSVRKVLEVLRDQYRVVVLRKGDGNYEKGFTTAYPKSTFDGNARLFDPKTDFAVGDRFAITSNSYIIKEIRATVGGDTARTASAGWYPLTDVCRFADDSVTPYPNEIDQASSVAEKPEAAKVVEAAAPTSKFKVGDKVVAVESSPYRGLFDEEYGVVRGVLDGAGYRLDFFLKSNGTFTANGKATWYDYELEAYAPTPTPAPVVPSKSHEMYVLNKEYGIDGRKYPKGTRLFTRAEMLALPYKKPILETWSLRSPSENRFLVHENGHAASIEPKDYDTVVVTE